MFSARARMAVWLLADPRRVTKPRSLPRSSWTAWLGGQVVHGEDEGVVREGPLRLAAGEDVRHPVGHVPHVRLPGLHVAVLDGGEGGGEVLPRGPHGVLGGGGLGLDDVAHGGEVVLVVQHQLVDLEDVRVGGAHLLAHLLPQALQLFLGQGPRRLKALQLPLRGQARRRAGPAVRPPADPQTPDGDPR